MLRATALLACACAVALGAGQRTFYLNVGGKYLKDWDSASAVAPNVVNGQVVLLSENAGAYPCIIGAEQGHPTEWCNGGIPQLTNLSAHEAALTKTVERAVPAEFAGLVVFDWECWRPSWLTTFMTYRLASIDLAKIRHPNVTDLLTLTEIAATEYDEAVAALLVATQRLVKRLRPTSQAVGFYGFPRSFWTANGAWNSTLAPYWAETTLLAPSIYMHMESRSAGEAAFLKDGLIDDVRHAVDIAQRFAAGAPKVIAPYAWYRYDFPDTCTIHCAFLNERDQQIEFRDMFDAFPCTNGPAPGCVNAAVIWGAEYSAANATATKEWMVKHRAMFEPSNSSVARRSSPQRDGVAALSVVQIAALYEQGTQSIATQRARFEVSQRLLLAAPRDNLPPWKQCRL